MAPPVTPPITPFPSAPGIGFAEDATINAAFATAVRELSAARGRAPPFRVALIDLNGAPPFKWGGHNPQTMDFIASEAKIIALFAAFALRDMVRRFQDAIRAIRSYDQLMGLFFGAAPIIGDRKVDLFAAIRATMNPAILAGGHPLLSSASEHERLPKYGDVFALPPHAGDVDFTGPFRTALRQMIVPSSNDGAGTVIRGVGYSYISGTMQQTGLFRAGKGPWLAGDFVGRAHYVRIDSDNDQGVAQAGTALSMAKLMAIIAKQAVPLSGDSYTEMQRLLHDAVTGPDTPFLCRAAPDFGDDKLRIPLSAITHIKLGFAGLKARNGGHNVGSEVWRLEGLRRTGRVYALAFQNLNWAVTSSEDLAFVIRRAIEIVEH